MSEGRDAMTNTETMKKKPKWIKKYEVQGVEIILIVYCGAGK